MARATLSEIITRVSQDIQENTTGDITATVMSELLDYMTNNLYLPTDSTVTVNTTPEIKEFTFDGGLAVVIDGGLGTVTVTGQDFTTEYRAVKSFSGIALPAGTSPTFLVVSQGSVGPPYNIMHFNEATEGGEIRGTSFTANTDGTISVNKDMFAASVCLNSVGTFAGSDNVVVGIGIGDPTAIPTTPGAQVGENYVSRFRCAREGSGSGDETTWDLSATPVGKSTTGVEIFGLKQGDKIFPVIWTQEADNASVDVGELIFTVEEISI